jgi:hypothetical protein
MPTKVSKRTNLGVYIRKPSIRIARGYSAADAFEGISMRVIPVKGQSGTGDSGCPALPTAEAIYRRDEVETNPPAFNASLACHNWPGGEQP